MTNAFSHGKLAAMIGVGLAIVSGGTNRAAEFRTGDRVIVESDETIEGDLYVCAREVVVDGTIDGDFVVFANRATINGTVAGDLTVAAQTLLLAGSVGDDVRAAGQVLKLDSAAKVGDDVLSAGFSIETDEQSSIDGDVYYAGYQARFAGTVKKDLAAATNNCALQGPIAGDVCVAVGADSGGAAPQAFGAPSPVAMPMVPTGLTVGPSAEIGGKLSYRSPVEVEIEDPDRIAGGIAYEPIEAPTQAKPTALMQALQRVRRFASLAIIGLCVLMIAPRWTQRVSDAIKDRPLMSLGGGIVGMIAWVVLILALVVLFVLLAVVFGLLTLDEMVPVAVFVGAISLIGAISGFWFYTLYVAQVTVSLALGQIVFFWGKTERRIVPFLLGLVLLVILADLPRAGPIISGLVVLFGVGGLVLWLAGLRAARTEAAKTP